jgi:hypothetical protein
MMSTITMNKKPIPEKLPINIDPKKLEIVQFVIALKIKEESDRL